MKDDKKMRGLGDAVEKVTKATGIKKVVHLIFGDDCGCDKRRDKLNQMFPFSRKVECLTEEEYNYLDAFNWDSNQLDNAQQKELLLIYNRVFNLKHQPTNCSQCWIDIIKRLDVLYKEYKNEVILEMGKKNSRWGLDDVPLLHTFSIGITTYSYRFDRFLVPLVDSIRNSCDTEIVLGVNGNYHEKFNEKYRQEVLKLSYQYDNIFPFIYTSFRSLAKIWNNIVINSSSEYVLMLNDDTEINDKGFFDFIGSYIKELQTSFYMNADFGYFVIKKTELEKMGYFDERFLGIGWEDLEFKDRYKKIFKREMKQVNGVFGIKTFYDSSDAAVNQRIGNRKYSKFNEEIYEKKLKPVKQYPHEEFYRKNYKYL